ncbi:MAG: OmpA family protein [Deltaproteobacteria bacterium]|nr:OmpA family protein [Deltaproteobacteria bacterium]
MSNLNGEAQVQRIIKKKGHHGGHHGGAWKVAYADFVTAMMALFIVLWIMAQSQSIRQNVAQYFKDPGLLPHSQGLMENSNIGGEMPTPGHSQELQRPAPAPADVTDDAKRLEETKKKIQEMIAQMPELENLKDMIRLEITDEGLRIELMEKEDNRFFEVGSSTVNPQAQKIFGIISKELGLLPNHLSIEGHTDSRPYGKQNYTNWELSSDRANAARRLMDSLGLKPDQVAEVRGYADRRLFNNQDPNDYKNRRVSILVRSLEKDKEKPLVITPSPGNGGKKIEPPTPLATPVTPPALPALKPPAAPALPAQKPPPPPEKAKPEAGPAPGADKAKTATAQAPPPGPKETKPERGPLEDNLDLQKEILNLGPKPSPITIK